MTFQDEIQEEIEKGFIKQIADKILRGIGEITNAEEYLKQRWIWELLQNAKDVENKFGKVSVEIVLKNESVEFKHNGNPFSTKHLTNLIQQVSSKKDDKSEGDEQTGKFGTGFITTHTLSKVIEVGGIVQNREQEHKKFNFKLDRSGENSDELGIHIKEALDILKDVSNMPTQNNYEENRLEVNFDTTFKYNLDEEGLKSAKIGIRDLAGSIPFTLAFITKIKSISIQNHIDNDFTIYTRKNDITDKSGDTIEFIEIEKKSDKSNETIKIAILSNQQTNIAIEIQEKENKVYLKEPSENTPFLFCSFPLVGTSNFYFPVIVNSPKFLSTNERDWIHLLNPKSADVQINKPILEDAVQLIKKMIDYATENDWQSLYILAFTSIPEHREKIDLDWYIPNIQKELRKKLLKSEIVSTNYGKSTLDNTLIPYYRGKEKSVLFWNLCNDFIGTQIPQKEDIPIWYKIINSEYDNWGTNLKYDLETLLKDVEKETTLSLLAQNKFANDENRAIEWLNKVIEFVFNQAEQPEFFKSIAIIPNQLGKFYLIDELITDKDQKIPEQLKDVLIGLSNENWRKILIDSSINCLLPETQKRGVIEISMIIDRIIEINHNPVLVREAVYKLISFYSSEFTEKESSINWRKAVWQIAKDLDNLVPDNQELLGLIPTLWKKADEWLFNAMVNDIKDIDTEKLRVKLNKDTKEDAVLWLNNNFIQFYETNEKTRFYTDKAIFPNQEGLFRKKNDLKFDKIKYKEFKEILKKLGVNWYFLLLDENITAIKNFKQENPLGIIDISIRINGIIKGENTIQDEVFKSAIYDLVCIVPSDSFSDRKRLKDFAHAIYPDKVADTSTILPYIGDFDFSPCNEWILNVLIQQLSKIESLTLLQEFNENFKSKSNDDLLKWIDSFISFASSFENDRHKPLLDKFAIIPNQNCIFRTLKFLKKDDSIPTDLKEISNANHIGYDWNDELLHKDLIQTIFLFDENNTRNLTHLATQINGSVRDYDGDKQNKDFAELIFLLNESKTANNSKYKNLFSDFHAKRDSLIVGTLGEGEELSNVAKLIQNREKLSILASIAGNNDISTKQLEDIAKITQTVDMSKIVELAKQEEDKEKERQFHTNLGTAVEKVFENIGIEGVEVERNEIGQDYDLKNLANGFKIHLEIKSISVNKDFVKMTKWQGKNATLNPNNYVLCVLPKDILIPTEQYFLDHAKFVTNIGQLLTDKVKEATEFERQNFEVSNDDIRVDFENENYKFRIYKQIWEKGLTWQQFKQTLK